MSLLFGFPTHYHRRYAAPAFSPFHALLRDADLFDRGALADTFFAPACAARSQRAPRTRRTPCHAPAEPQPQPEPAEPAPEKPAEEPEGMVTDANDDGAADCSPRAGTPADAPGPLTAVAPREEPRSVEKARPATAPVALWTPRMDVERTDAGVVVRVDVPGMDRGAIKVSLSPDNRFLTLSGRRESEARGERGYYERSTGFFERSLRLPRGVQRDGVSAKCADGVLTVNVPLAAEPEAEAMEIEVQ
ncbi:unnamed protein product [Pedinophyceae sp. YPF-701]|nr:unnamed protein product [Pedinophyceae sp. YPF-701]